MYCETADRLNIYYEIRGNTSSRDTIVFLNGLTQTTQAWAFFIPQFQDRYRILLVDFIFQGRSDKTGEWRDFDRHAEDVKRVIDREGLCPVLLVGLSYGSLVAQHFAVNYPGCVKKLALISTFASKTPYYQAIETAWWGALDKGGYGLMFDVMLPSIFSEEYLANPLIPIDMMKEMRKEANQSPEAIFKLMRATKERPSYLAQLEKIQCPALIIQGERDLLLPVPMAGEVQAHIRNSKLVIIPRAGHSLNIEHAGEVAGELAAFFK
jgi:3-oxoadipate enol-lactonase